MTTPSCYSLTFFNVTDKLKDQESKKKKKDQESADMIRFIEQSLYLSKSMRKITASMNFRRFRTLVYCFSIRISEADLVAIGLMYP